VIFQAKTQKNATPGRKEEKELIPKHKKHLGHLCVKLLAPLREEKQNLK
jgi:hypothetical protein